MRGRIALVLALVLALALLLAGCGEGTAPPVQDEEEPLPWMEEAPPEEPEPEAVLPAAFALPYHRDLSLDPVSCPSALQYNVAMLLYEPLFALDGAFEPQPVLCDRWEHSEDWTRWTLHIRENVPFSDGTLLTAADAAASLRRATDSERYGYRLRQVASVAADRAGNVVVTLSAPNSAFLSLLDIPIVKAGTERTLCPAGTGPYCYFAEEGEAWLAPSGSWWQGRDLPLERISLVHAKDLDSALALFSSRQVQLYTADLTGSQTISLPEGTRWVDTADTTLQFIGVNCAHPLLADPAVRRALEAGLSREQMVQGLLSGHARAARFPIHPASALYPVGLEKPYRYENFLAALSAAGLNSGVPRTLTLLVNQENSFKVSAARFAAGESLCNRLMAEAPLLPVCWKNTSVLTHEGVVEGMAATGANVFWNFADWTVRLREGPPAEEPSAP